ncbi:MAG: hypothetical protein QOG04_312 [Actinomycetota bacterium]|nr:hypothetical protein [Actinomycetota bacterium]
MNKTAWVGVAIVGLIAAVVLVLALGGAEETGTSDLASDVVVGEGTGQPGDTALAEITEVSVRNEDAAVVVFEVTIATDFPDKVPGSLGFRWDVIENGEGTWIVSANLDNGPTAAVTGLKSDFGASTVDETLDGDIEVSGDTLTITFDRTQIEGFPDSFAWRLTSTLDGDPADPGSATATDSAPDSGQGQLK